LLRALGPPWEYNSEAGPSCTLIKLIYSLRALPVDLTSETVRMLAWYMLHLDLEGPDKKVIYCGLGLLWLTLQRTPQPADRDLVNLSEWIVRRESELAQQFPGGFDRWLLGMRGNNRLTSSWEALGLEFLSLDLRSHQRQLQEWVKLIGSGLAGDSAS